MRPLVIVRPEPGASATAKAAEQIGLTALAMPLFEVQPQPWPAPKAADFDGLLLTSANAVRHAGEKISQLRSLPSHCVGESTAAEARAAGLCVSTVGHGGIEALLELLPPGLRLLHLCGAERREPSAPRQSIQPLPVYRAAELPPPNGVNQLESAVIAVHSPRAASRMAEVADELGLRREGSAIAAISAESAAAAGDGWQSVEVSNEPTDAALLALASSLCNKP